MLQKIGFQPGINKQLSETGAEGQWTGCDNARFRYGVPVFYFKEIALALALVSTLVVDDVISKGPSGELVCVLLG